MSFETFKKKAEKAGLVAVDHTDWHWQIKGGANTVNYYPTKDTIFINGTKQGIRGGIDEAIKLANAAPKKTGKVHRRSSAYYKRIKMQMLRYSQICHWCSKVLTAQTATVDHRIPLKRGGSDLKDNLVLACNECNAKRGHDMPELR